jgi:TPP-dependent pyruvate/acetoin dehydrogenase alpha subunit
MNLVMFKKVSARVFAYFVMTALGMIGTGTIVGINMWQAALMAGIAGVANVVEGLARAYVGDGNLTAEEVDEVFNAAPVKKS